MAVCDGTVVKVSWYGCTSLCETDIAILRKQFHSSRLTLALLVCLYVMSLSAAKSRQCSAAKPPSKKVMYCCGFRMQMLMKDNGSDTSISGIYEQMVLVSRSCFTSHNKSGT